MPHLVRSSAFRMTSSLLAMMIIAPHVALAAGPTKAQCVESNTQAQGLVQDHKLHAARETLRLCASAGCPSAVQSDCTERLDAVERAMPSIVFDVKDGDGNDLTAVKITVDGAPFADKLDGSAIEIDPGEHDISLEAAGQAPVVKKIVVHDSEKSRHESIVIGAPTAKPASPPAIPKFAPPPPRPFNVQKTAGASVAVVGLLSLTVGAFLGLAASSQSPSTSCSLPISCGSNGTQGKQDDAANNASASTIFFIAGGVLAAGGVVLFLTAPKTESQPQPATASVSIAPSATPGGGGLLMRGAF